MSIEWITKEEKKSAITIFNNNITFSKNATNLFSDCYGILVGIDKENNSLIFKKIMHEQVLNNEYNKEDLYPLNIKPTYGRINSKQLVSSLTDYFKFDFLTNQSYKYDAKWNMGTNMLIVQMNGGK